MYTVCLNSCVNCTRKGVIPRCVFRPIFDISLRTNLYIYIYTRYIGRYLYYYRRLYNARIIYVYTCVSIDTQLQTPISYRPLTDGTHCLFIGDKVDLVFFLYTLTSGLTRLLPVKDRRRFLSQFITSSEMEGGELRMQFPSSPM